MFDPRPGDPVENDDFDVDIEDGAGVVINADEQQAATQTEKPVEDKKPETGDVEIEIEDDPNYKPDWEEDPVKVAQKVAEESKAERSKAVKKRIDTLTAANSELARQRDNASKERQDAIDYARKQAEMISDLQRQIATGTDSYLSMQHQAADSALAVAQREYRDALNAGDTDKLAEANKKISILAVQAEQARQTLESRKAQAQLQSQQQQQFQPQVQQSQFQQQRQAPQVDSKATEWKTKNAWFNPNGSDPLSVHARNVHIQFVSQNPDQVGTDVYYQHIDKEMREAFPANFGVAQKPTASSPVVPNTRSAATNQQATVTSTGKVRLTRSQVAMANRLGLTTPAELKAYALEIAGRGN